MVLEEKTHPFADLAMNLVFRHPAYLGVCLGLLSVGPSSAGMAPLNTDHRGDHMSPDSSHSVDSAS